MSQETWRRVLRHWCSTPCDPLMSSNHVYVWNIMSILCSVMKSLTNCPFADSDFIFSKACLCDLVANLLWIEGLILETLHLVSVVFVNFLLAIRIGTVPYRTAGDQMHCKEDRCRSKIWTRVSDLRYSEWRSLRSLRTRWFWWGEVCFVGSKKRSSQQNLSDHFIYETSFWILGIKVPSETWRPVFCPSEESSDQVT